MPRRAPRRNDGGPIRCALYMRMSTDRQDISIEKQRRIMYQFMDATGRVAAIEFIDEGIRVCRQKSLLQIITARSWQAAKYDAVLLA